MPYLLVRDSDSGSLIDGLPYSEITLVAMKTESAADVRDEKNRRVCFGTDTLNIINALELLGYKVVTSANFGPTEFIWTLFKK